MIEFGSYDQAIVHTLRKRAVQSAILIDDSFPTYEDCLAVGRKEGTIEAEYPDVDSARRLYRTLHEARIVCDVENRIDVIDDDFIEKIRKSDLVVLDWNLKRGSEDSDDAERVLSGLAKSSHFNLVVVYTRATDLTAVWTRAAVGLRGGWQNAEHFVGTIQLEDGLDFEDIIEKIDPDGRVEVVSDEMLRQYITGGFRAVEDVKELRDALGKAGVPKSSQRAFVEALVHRAAIKRHGVEVERPAFIVEGTANDEVRHLVCGSVFIAFMSKAINEKGGEEPSIFECLDQALVAWKPNLLQLLVSELQNELEQNSYAFNQILVPSIELKAGWIYHMLNGYASDGEAGLRALVASLNERLVEALERAVWASMVDETSTLLTFGKQAAKLALGELGEAGKGEEKLIAKAMEATSMNDNDSSRQNVMHALNEYLSSDLFRGGHVTTGTVFSSADRKEWFVCVSPACDMVPRPPKDKDSWPAKLEPLQPMHLLKLLSCKPTNALEDAELGVQLFVSIEGERRYLKAVADDAPLPRPYTCLIENNSKPGDEAWQKHGFVVHHIAFANGAASLTQDRLFAVAQLRPAYGARLMHLAGSHQSRVGVDFVRYGKRKSSGNQASSDSGKGHEPAPATGTSPAQQTRT